MEAFCGAIKAEDVANVSLYCICCSHDESDWPNANERSTRHNIHYCDPSLSSEDSAGSSSMGPVQL
jgi:hypothetical protein